MEEVEEIRFAASLRLHYNENTVMLLSIYVFATSKVTLDL